MRTLFIAGFVTLILGLVFVFLSSIEADKVASFGQTPERLTLQELIDRGPLGQKNVIITNFSRCQNYVVEMKGKRWQCAYIPIVPGLFVDEPPHPSRVQVVVADSQARNETDLEFWWLRQELSGLVVGTVADLGSDEQQLLRQAYPETDFNQCLVISKGAEVAQPGGPEALGIFGYGLTGVGSLLIGIGVVKRLRRVNTPTPVQPLRTAPALPAHQQTRPRQLVGQVCPLCEQRIASEIDANFCRSCGCPVHTACSQATLAAGGEVGCLTCGIPRPVLEEISHRQQVELEALHESQLSQTVLADASRGIILMICGGIVTFTCTGLMAGQGYFVIATGALAGGLGLIIRAISTMRKRR